MRNIDLQRNLLNSNENFRLNELFFDMKCMHNFKTRIHKWGRNSEEEMNENY